MRTNLYRYVRIVLLALPVLTLAACTPRETPMSPAYPPPITVSTDAPTPVPTSEVIDVTIIPSPMPTQPAIPTMLSPDPIQVERWREYQTALAKSFLSYLPAEEVICEWDILGRSDQEVYVWAVCEGPVATVTGTVWSATSSPAVMHR